MLCTAGHVSVEAWDNGRDAGAAVDDADTVLPREDTYQPIDPVIPKDASSEVAPLADLFKVSEGEQDQHGQDQHEQDQRNQEQQPRQNEQDSTS